MGFKQADPASTAADNECVVKIGFQQRKYGGKSTALIHFNKAFMEEYFPGVKAGDKFRVDYGTGDDKGKVIIAPNPDGKVVLVPYGKHQVLRLRVAAWGEYAKAKMPSRPAVVLMSIDTGGVVVVIPTE